MRAFGWLTSILNPKPVSDEVVCWVVEILSIHDPKFRKFWRTSFETEEAAREAIRDYESKGTQLGTHLPVEARHKGDSAAWYLPKAASSS